MHPRRDAIGSRPEMTITNDSAVERRLLGPAAVIDPCSDDTRWRLVLDAAPDFRFVETLQNDFQGGRGQLSWHGASPILAPINGTT
jgi:hypothetical protein